MEAAAAATLLDTDDELVDEVFEDGQEDTEALLDTAGVSFRDTPHQSLTVFTLSLSLSLSLSLRYLGAS